MIRLYNTFTKKLEQPDSNHLSGSDYSINLYSCGPTVYDLLHIGNLRSFVFADTLRRAFAYHQYQVNWVMNITDVDDKTIRKTIEQFGPEATPKDLKTFTEKYTQLFQNDLVALGIPLESIRFQNVSDSIPEIIDFIKKLMDLGFGYTTEDGSVYFNIEKYQDSFHDYGKLVGESFLSGKKVGARVKVDEYDKENLSDFALWKAHSPEDGKIFWEDPSGVLKPGRPGWHIECSAINFKMFSGEQVAIHTGGIDLTFPHHTNELAQSNPIYGKQFVKTWCHNEHLLIDGKKMSKSLGNVYTLADLQKKDVNAGMILRYLFSQSHYQTQMNFTFESFEAAKNGLKHLQNTATQYQSGEKLEPEYELQLRELIGNNLDTAGVLAKLWETLKDDKITTEIKHGYLIDCEQLLGIPLFTEKKEEVIPDDIKKLAEEREQARTEKDFTKSDELRVKIESLGYEVKDTPEGSKINKK
jgi:cysteinyl-tRNA synthetase